MKILKMSCLAILALFAAATPLLAQGGGTGGSYVFTGMSIGAGLGSALTIIGAGYGLGRIGSSALESMARQPEVAGRIQTAMLIIAALLEGVTFFSLIICFGIAGRQGGIQL
jgi:F-type H+-transporting ATPase subunit c